MCGNVSWWFNSVDLLHFISSLPTFSGDSSKELAIVNGDLKGPIADFHASQ
jgi:hypothetical protein